MNKIKVLVVIICFFSLILDAQENNSILCSDGIDNDGDGLVDCADGECFNLFNNGCTTCIDGVSFADTLLEYIPGCPHIDLEPEGALGISDWTGGTSDEFQFVFLGQGGRIKLGFTNNLIVNSGDTQFDVHIFEVGPVVEPCKIALRPANIFTETQLIAFGLSDLNGDGYYDMGSIMGAEAGVDIDALLPGFSGGELQFYAIEIMDIDDAPCHNGTVGADIDAVCALSFVVLDCADVPNGTSIIDSCGICLEPTDLNFNQSCITVFDCANVPNGTSIIDSCGICLEPTDPNFNQSCITVFDCADVPNGTSIIDSCGICLEPTDLNFNQSCITVFDCADVSNGTSIIDSCGICLEPTDPDFNQSCIAEYDIYIPNVFSPNKDGINDRFRIFAANGTIVGYSIFDRWGELVYKNSNFSINSNSSWWNGTFRGEELQAAVFIYVIEVEFIDGFVKSYTGDVLLLR